MNGEQVTLVPMTRDMYHALFSGFGNEPAIYERPEDCKPWVYAPERVDAAYDRRLAEGKVLLGVMAGGEIAGEVRLHTIDRAAGSCWLSIHLKHDGFKDRGIGTAAEKLALHWAFERLGLTKVLADVMPGNVRSCHVLEKVGFRRIGMTDGMVQFAAEKETVQTNACGISAPCSIVWVKDTSRNETGTKNQPACPEAPRASDCALIPGKGQGVQGPSPWWDRGEEPLAGGGQTPPRAVSEPSAVRGQSPWNDFVLSSSNEI